jgi:hypothetical protein
VKLEAAENRAVSRIFPGRSFPIWTFTSVGQDIKQDMMAQKRKVQDAFGKPGGAYLHKVGKQSY